MKIIKVYIKSILLLGAFLVKKKKEGREQI